MLCHTDPTGDWLTVKQLADLAGVSTRTLSFSLGSQVPVLVGNT